VRASKQLFGKTILSRRSSDVFALDPDYRADPEGLDARKYPGLEVSQAQLGELVDLAWDQPHILSLKDLPQIRKRLKNGDRIYITRENSRVLLVSWVSTTPRNAANSEPESVPMESTPALVIEECWRANDQSSAAAYSLLISVIAGEARRTHAGLLVHCGRDQAVLRAELERLGFRPKFHSTRYRILHRFHRESVSRHPNSDRPPATV
jgi:hypothetical protein